jgi:hypothetical protein
LHVEEEGILSFPMIASFMGVVAVAASVIAILAWLIYRDWAVAWNVGACFVPLLLGLGGWISLRDD